MRSTILLPLTFQARGAKQPLPEPDFMSPPITEADLQLLQMLAPTAKEAYPKDHSNLTSDIQPVTSIADDSHSSSSSDSDSSSSSKEEALPNAGDKSFLVINNKSRVVHAASRTNPSSTKRACFTVKVRG